MPFRVPDALESRRGLGPEWARWLDGLPRLVPELLAEWELTTEGEVPHGRSSLVLPVRTSDGTPAVLKVGLPVRESEHEALALQHWGGNGAVRLLRADPRRRALVLERLHASSLAHLWDVEACEVVGGLLGRLHVPAPPQVDRVVARVADRTEGLTSLPRSAPVPRRLVEQAISLGRQLAEETSYDGGDRLLHTDLHYDHVLAGDRSPWLAIDPKPLAGDPHYEVAPLLWTRWDELTGDVRAGVRRRFHAVVDSAGLDEDRARDWVVVRMAHHALATLTDDPTLADPGARDFLTACISVAKAVQD